MKSGQKHKRGKGETTSGNMSRRAAMTVLGLAPSYAKLVAEAVVAEPGVNIVHGIFQGPPGEPAVPTSSTPKKHPSIVYDLFFSGAGADIVPASNWGHKKAYVEVRPGVLTYPHEAHVMRSMRGLFPDSTRWIRRDDAWDVDPKNSLILLGSGVSNLATRAFLGDKSTPKWTVSFPQGNVDLAYSMVHAQGTVEREQYGEIYKGPASAIVNREGRQIAKPETQKGELREDYLLVTRLPGWGGGKETSVIVFAGLHAPGTRSTELIFSSIHPNELSYLGNEIGFSGKSSPPFFQAVFRARRFRTEDGSFVPQELTCVSEDCPPVILKLR